MQRVFPRAHTQERIDDVAARLATSGSLSVVVVDEDGALAGIVTVPDVEQATAADNGARALGDIATRRVVTARVGQFVADAIAQAGAEVAR